MADQSIFIPVQNSQEKVRVPIDQLPLDHNDLLDLLKAEQAPLDIWLSLAREYFKQGNLFGVRDILEEGSSSDVDKFYSDVVFERIAILNALTSFHTMRANSLNVMRPMHKENLNAKSKEDREKSLIEAVKFSNKASHISSEDLSTWIGKGRVQVAKGDFRGALQMFGVVVKGGKIRETVLGFLGQACALYNEGKYQMALDTYEAIVRGAPSCPGCVRLGIGLCHYQLQYAVPELSEQRLAKARAAFERVLELEPDNAEALLYLAMLDINSDDVATLEVALNRVKASFEVFPHNAMALNQLGNHFFFSDKRAMVKTLLEASTRCTMNPELLAESHFLLGRTYHAEEDWENAFLNYEISINLTPPKSDFILPHFEFARVQLKREEFDSALSSVQRVLQLFPNSCEALKLTGMIQKKKGLRKEALATFKKVTSLDQGDEEAWKECAELSASYDLTAIESLNKAKSFLSLKGVPVPLEILNNSAAIHFIKKEYPEAKKLYFEALGEGPWSAMESASFELDHLEKSRALDDSSAHLASEDKVPVDKVAMLFNLALLLEATRENSRAIFLYKLILKSYPNYLDAYLRLAIMHQKKFHWEKSLDLISKCLTLDPSNIDALLLQSTAESRLGLTSQSKESLKKCLEASGNSPPAVANVALGNWNLSMSWSTPKMEAAFREKAKEYFAKALSHNNSNLFAASGLGCVFAEKGQFDVAKQIFNSILETSSLNWSSNVPEIWQNLAHIHLAKSELHLAIKMYQNCLKRSFYGSNGDVFLNLARAQYESNLFKNANKTLKKAIHLFPTNQTLRFNVAIVFQKTATVTVNNRHATVQEATEAVSAVNSAVGLFKELLSLCSQPKAQFDFDSKKCQSHIEFCSNLLGKAKLRLENAEKEERRRKQEEEVARRKAQAIEAKKKAEEDKKLEEERLRREEEDRLAADLEARFQERLAARTEAEAEPKKKKGEKKRKKSKKWEEEDDRFLDDEDVELEADVAEREEEEADVAHEEEAEVDEPGRDLEDEGVEDAPEKRSKVKRKRPRVESDDELNDDMEDTAVQQAGLEPGSDSE